MAFFLLFAVSLAFPPNKIATQIIRFQDEHGNILYGQFLGDNKAQLIKGDIFGSRELTNEVRTVATLLAPVPQPNSIVGIGLNYWGHINATHLDPPKTPSVFYKHRFSYHHPFKPIIIPAHSTKPDYEGELGFVFAKNCKDVSEDDALDCVLGYTVCHDVSARCYQTEKAECLGNGGQFSFSKGFDNHAPLGPVLVTTDELGDGSNLQIQTFVNNDLRQNQTTSELVYGVKKIVSFMTIGTTYEKGDVVCTGTPDGVGDTMVPPVYLQDGDTVTISISNIGVLMNPIKYESSKTSLKQETPRNLEDFISKKPFVVV